MTTLRSELEEVRSASLELAFYINSLEKAFQNQEKSDEIPATDRMDATLYSIKLAKRHIESVKTELGTAYVAFTGEKPLV